MTQTALAGKLGVSQSFISAIENGRRRIAPDVEADLRAVLAQHLVDVDPVPVPEFEFDWSPARPDQPLALPLPLEVTQWERRQPSGDLFLCIAVRKDVLVLAVDVSGHGIEAAPKANYLAGWMQGWASALVASPRLDAVVGALRTGLEVSEVEASWFVALLSRVGPHKIEYSAQSHAFPAPLLMLDDADLTFESTSTARALRHLELPAPWSLVIASDGLLERMGAGREAAGKRSLLRWQSGHTRKQPPAERFAAGEPQVDDETLMIVRWNDWDLDFQFDNEHTNERERIEGSFARWAEDSTNRDTSIRIENILGEILDNVDEHAYAGASGKVRVRARDEETRLRVRVEDAGPWRGEPVVGRGLAYTRATADFFDVVRIYPQGMQVSFTVNKPEEGRE
jgi:anti-sigma regulatory factor (Ser/Thr protein kinase)/transcriptional regulator with XRE-family HTH domain